MGFIIILIDGLFITSQAAQGLKQRTTGRIHSIVCVEIIAEDNVVVCVLCFKYIHVTETQVNRPEWSNETSIFYTCVNSER